MSVCICLSIKLYQTPTPTAPATERRRGGLLGCRLALRAGPLQARGLHGGGGHPGHGGRGGVRAGAGQRGVAAGAPDGVQVRRCGGVVVRLPIGFVFVNSFLPPSLPPSRPTGRQTHSLPYSNHTRHTYTTNKPTTPNQKQHSYDDAEDLALRLYGRAALQSEEHYLALGSLMLRMEARGLDTTGGER